MSFTNLITEAIDSVYDDIKAGKTPTVCELGNQRLRIISHVVKFLMHVELHNMLTQLKNTFKH